MDKEVLTIIALGLVFVGAIVPRIGLDLVAILALGVLVLGDVITPDQAAAGFGNTTMLTVACMFVLAAALQQTGAVEAVTTLARRRGRRGMICYGDDIPSIDSPPRLCGLSSCP